MAEPTRLRVIIALALVYVVWGSTYLAIKIGLEGLPPMLLAGSRFLLAGGVMLAWAMVRARRRGTAVRPSVRQWRAAAVTGLLLLVGGNGAVTVAEQDIDSGLAALLVAAVPLWIALMDRVRYGQRLSRVAVLGLVIGFVGVALLVRPSGDGQLGASLLVLVGGVAWAAGSLTTRGAPLPADNILTSAMQMLTAAVAFLAIAGISGEVTSFDPSAVTLRALVAVAYLAAFGSVVGFTAYTWLIRNVAASTVATYAYVNPVVAVLLGFLVLGERLTTPTLLAAGLVVSAVALIIGARKPAPRPAAAPPALRTRATDARVPEGRVPVEV